MKVILVGNGSSVLDNEMGEYIDSEFDLVYRINRFKTKGFENYVGNRVDGWFLADTGVQWIIVPKEEIEGSMRWKEFEYVFIYCPNFKYDIGKIEYASNIIDEIQMIPPTYEDNINSIVDLKPMWPTTGLVSIQFLLENYQNIYIHGFDSHNDKYEYIHYYDKGDPDRLTSKYKQPRVDHNYNAEKKYLNLLRKEGKVIDIV
tara:strand:+ start:89 stop:694 length:606 start_codon:yes stop_codon:yes gene_type:complete